MHTRRRFSPIVYKTPVRGAVRVDVSVGRHGSPLSDNGEPTSRVPLYRFARRLRFAVKSFTALQRGGRKAEFNSR